MVSVDYLIFESSEWSIRSSCILQEAIDEIIRRKDRCIVMLTGGTAAEKLYRIWGLSPRFKALKRVRFLFGDERCVPHDHPESNFGMAMKTLFAEGVPEGCRVFRMEAENGDSEAAADRYAEVVGREDVDVLLLGVGEDGHIASLFPNSPALREQTRKVVPVSGPKPPSERLTVTPKIITQTRSVFILAAGAAKARVLARALRDPENVAALPARMVLGATWLLDHSWKEFAGEK